MRARGATAASTVTYLIPVFSTLLGAIVLGETLHWNQPSGPCCCCSGSRSRRAAYALGLAERLLGISSGADCSSGSSVVSGACSPRAISSASVEPGSV